ncbi:MAG: DNA-processing protein DprA [Phycisphaerales bacterium]|nr:DNA-processing protein DprA [Phycisphaerales bacterium]MCI0631466.1 DNA-processing protein DprA [Phycisphaerales bacterium]MCI0675461.1 DNA-processing protein DprA [Phycisphaerales bacterium]
MPRLANNVPDSTFRLLLAEGIGPATLRKLRTRFSNDDQVVSASTDDFAGLDGIGRETAQALRRAIDAAEPDDERTAMLADGTQLILQGDPDYPALLAAIDDAPAALWIRGALHPTDRLSIALVGSRKCSAYGREQAGRFAALLAQAGLTIVSGGALGIDGEAHLGALRVNGRTIVVAGCGLATNYPPEHESLFSRIVENGGGAIISEFPMSTPPAAGNFPRRNRIISGLSLGVLVIEAALRSGALITARLAAEEHHREVMALPGRVDSPASAGCLKIIKEGWAALVTDHADVLNQLDSSHQLVRGALEAAGHPNASSSATLFDTNLTRGQQTIVEVLTDAGDPLLVDQIAARTQLPLNQIMADLTLLQIRGRVQRDFSGSVRLKR